MNKRMEVAAHDGTVSALAITIDSRFVVSGGCDGVIRIWDLPELIPRFNFSHPYKGDIWWDNDNPEHRGPQANAVNCIGVAPDSRSIATGDNHGTVYLWSLTGGEPLASLSAGKTVVSGVRFIGNSESVIAASYDGRAYLWRRGLKPRWWELKRRWTKRIIRGDFEHIWSLGVPPSASCFIVGDSAGRICERTWPDLQKTFLYQEQTFAPFRSCGVTCLVYSPNNRWLASGTYSARVRLWQRQTASLMWTVRLNDAVVRDVAFNPDGDLLAVADDSMLAVVSTANGEVVDLPECPSDGVLRLAWSRDGKWLATGNRDGRLWLYDAADVIDHPGV